MDRVVACASAGRSDNKPVDSELVTVSQSGAAVTRAFVNVSRERETLMMLRRKPPLELRESLEVSRASLPGRGKTKRTDARFTVKEESSLVGMTRRDDGDDREIQTFVLLRPLGGGSSSRGSLLAMVSIQARSTCHRA